MIKFRISSDLHLEFRDYKSHINNLAKDYNSYNILKKTEEDKNQILLLAGDICQCNRIEQNMIFFEEISKRFKQVYMVLGNHEHYQNNFNNTYNDILKYLKKFENIKLLEKESVVIDGVALFGATLWTNFNNNPMIEINSANGINDFRVINVGPDVSYRKHILNTKRVIAEYEETLEQLKVFLHTYKKHKKIVMTHFQPSLRSVHPQYKDSNINPYFCNSLDWLIEENDIDIWVGGHIHNSQDYILGKTRIIANPLGYGLENPEYKNDLILEL